MNVQAIISNISFPKTIQELRAFFKDHPCFNVEDILYSEDVEWTVPKWMLPHDIVFFFHAKTAIQSIRRLQTELQNDKQIQDHSLLTARLNHARALYELYGGKIFAVGRVAGKPFCDREQGEPVHWKGKIYAAINSIQVLEHPVDISVFSSFIQISRQSAVTPVLGDSFETLKKIICADNKVPDHLMNSRANPAPLNRINSENWLELTQDYRRAFFLEIQFRKFYVDYLLSAIADRKKIFSECACYKADKLVGYADNCIWLDGKLCFVEVKLNLDTEKNIVQQLVKYSDAEHAVLQKGEYTSDNIAQKNVIVIDTRRIGVFRADSKQIFSIADLDTIKDTADLHDLRNSVIQFMRQCD